LYGDDDGPEAVDDIVAAFSYNSAACLRISARACSGITDFDILETLLSKTFLAHPHAT
jgi:hypothetical protein